MDAEGISGHDHDYSGDRSVIRILTLSAALAFTLAATPATHSDAPEHAWYTQQYNLNGGNCCGLGDAYILEDDEWKNVDGHYFVKIEGEWHEVRPWQRRDLAPGNPPYNPLRGTPSPSHKAVVWYAHREGEDLHIYCFSPWENLY